MNKEVKQTLQNISDTLQYDRGIIEKVTLSERAFNYLIDQIKTPTMLVRDSKNINLTNARMFGVPLFVEENLSPCFLASIKYWSGNSLMFFEIDGRTYAISNKTWEAMSSMI